MSPVLSVLSWNMLASAYARPEHYPYTPAPILDKRTRDAAVLARLVRDATCNLLCLQEVEPAMFAAAKTHLDARYEGHFLQKQGRPEGCAIFVERSVGRPTFRELVYGDGTGHVAVGAVIDRIDGIGAIGVASTHLRWQAADVPPDERLGRAELTELLDAWVTPDAAVPWIICGDLNAEAGSPVLGVAFARGFRDAYASLPDACTSNANAKRKRIDFILHAPVFVATPTPLAVITDVTPLPSADEPSDHLAIRATLTLAGRSARSP